MSVQDGFEQAKKPFHATVPLISDPGTLKI
jgi:hypothetical protein